MTTYNIDSEAEIAQYLIDGDAVSGDIVNIAAGVYDMDQFEAGDPLAPASGVIVRGAGINETFIHGGLVVDHYDSGVGSLTLEDLTFDGSDNSGNTIHSTKCLIAIEDCNLTANRVCIRNIVTAACDGLVLFAHQGAVTCVLTDCQASDGAADLFSAKISSGGTFGPASHITYIRPVCGNPGDADNFQCITTHSRIGTTVIDPTINITRGVGIAGDATNTPVEVFGGTILTTATHTAPAVSGCALINVSCNGMLQAEDGGIVRGCTAQSIRDIAGKTGAIIEGNTITFTDNAASTAAVSVSGIATLVRQNKITMSASGAADIGIYVGTGAGCIVEENEVTTDRYGIFCTGATSIVRRNKVISNSSTLTAIYIGGASVKDAYVQGNACIGFATAFMAGVHVVPTVDAGTLVISGNLIYGCDLGIRIDTTATGAAYTYTVSVANNICLALVNRNYFWMKAAGQTWTWATTGANLWTTGKQKYEQGSTAYPTATSNDLDTVAAAVDLTGATPPNRQGVKMFQFDPTGTSTARLYTGALSYLSGDTVGALGTSGAHFGGWDR